MAVDNFYRLIVMGPRRDVSHFRRLVSQTVRRPAIGKIKGWREFVPISIEAIRSRSDKVRRATSPALDPLEISVWPTRFLDNGRAELRYQFQTRNDEFIDVLRPLSRGLPSLTLVLVTLWLDDSDIASLFVRRGRNRSWNLPDRRREWHWDRAREKYGLEGDAVYDDDEASFFAEQGMLDEALAHWMPHSTRRRRWSWWNRRATRDLEFERELALYTVAEQVNAEEQKGAVKASVRGRRRQVKVTRIDPGLLRVEME